MRQLTLDQRSTGILDHNFRRDATSLTLRIGHHPAHLVRDVFPVLEIATGSLNRLFSVLNHLIRNLLDLHIGMQERLKPEVARFFLETIQLGLGRLETVPRLAATFPIISHSTKTRVLVVNRSQCGNGVG